jgi:hypothetical protein
MLDDLNENLLLKHSENQKAFEKSFFSYPSARTGMLPSYLYFDRKLLS